MKIDNPPAFPTDGEHQPAQHYMHYEGMTLRDYFAGQALIAIYSKDGYGSSGGNPIRLTERCYEIADAMLLERSKTAKEKNEL